MNTLMKKLDESGGRWIVVLIWTTILTILLLQPLENPVIPTGVQPAPPSFTRELLFSTAHMLVFTGTGILWTWALNKRLTMTQAAVGTVLVLFLYGVLTELGQTRTPGRAAQRIDILANTLGAICGSWLYIKLLSQLRPLSLRTF